METEIKQKLDQLAEWNAQKDIINLNKRALLDEVKIPAEVEAVVKNGMASLSKVDREFAPLFREIDADADAKLAEMVVPDEIKAALALIDANRRMINESAALRRQQAQGKIQARKAELQAEIEANTRNVYDEIAIKKAEIEAEFGGAEKALAENIQKLEDEIKADTVKHGATVKSKFFQAVYNRGRITWNTDMMEAWINDHPFLKQARKEGAPSISIRPVK